MSLKRSLRNSRAIVTVKQIAFLRLSHGHLRDTLKSTLQDAGFSVVCFTATAQLLECASKERWQSSLSAATNVALVGMFSGQVGGEDMVQLLSLLLHASSIHSFCFLSTSCSAEPELEQFLSRITGTLTNLILTCSPSCTLLRAVEDAKLETLLVQEFAHFVDEKLQKTLPSRTVEGTTRPKHTPQGIHGSLQNDQESISAFAEQLSLLADYKCSRTHKLSQSREATQSKNTKTLFPCKSTRLGKCARSDTLYSTCNTNTASSSISQHISERVWLEEGEGLRLSTVISSDHHIEGPCSPWKNSLGVSTSLGQSSRCLEKDTAIFQLTVTKDSQDILETFQSTMTSKKESSRKTGASPTPGALLNTVASLKSTKLTFTGQRRRFIHRSYAGRGSSSDDSDDSYDEIVHVRSRAEERMFSLPEYSRYYAWCEPRTDWSEQLPPHTQGATRQEFYKTAFKPAANSGKVVAWMHPLNKTASSLLLRGARSIRVLMLCIHRAKDWDLLWELASAPNSAIRALSVCIFLKDDHGYLPAVCRALGHQLELLNLISMRDVSGTVEYVSHVLESCKNVETLQLHVELRDNVSEANIFEIIALSCPKIRDLRVSRFFVKQPRSSALAGRIFDPLLRLTNLRSVLIVFHEQLVPRADESLARVIRLHPSLRQLACASSSELSLSESAARERLHAVGLLAEFSNVYGTTFPKLFLTGEARINFYQHDEESEIVNGPFFDSKEVDEHVLKKRNEMYLRALEERHTEFAFLPAGLLLALQFACREKWKSWLCNFV